MSIGRLDGGNGLEAQAATNPGPSRKPASLRRSRLAGCATSANASSTATIACFMTAEAGVCCQLGTTDLFLARNRLTLSRFESILGYKGWNSFVNRRRRPGLSWSGFPRSPYPNDEAIFDEQYLRDDNEGYQRQSAGRDNTPLGLSRFKANAEAWRRKLQRELLLAPLTAAERERIMRWLINLRAREAWQAARLEHTIATKRLLIEALGEEEAD